MIAEPSTEAVAIRARVRETEQTARRLITRAAHMEKLARRARADSGERLDLNARAQELRTAAAVLLAEVSELSRQVRTA